MEEEEGEEGPSQRGAMATPSASGHHLQKRSVASSAYGSVGGSGRPEQSAPSSYATEESELIDEATIFKATKNSELVVPRKVGSPGSEEA